jgi:fatty acid desaturase/cytochrome b involved in lipid metabolism
MMFKRIRIDVLSSRVGGYGARARAAHARARPSDGRRDARRDAESMPAVATCDARALTTRRRARARQDVAVTSATIRRRPRARTTTTTTTRIDAISDAMGHESADDATATATAAGDDGKAKKPWGFLSPFGASAAVLEQAAEVNEKQSGRRRRAEEVKLKVDGQWYDATGWALAHPGGAGFVRLLNGQDATDVFYALHSYGPNGSDEALKRLRALPKCDAPYDTEEYETQRLTTANAEFGELRGKLEAEGWFKRNALSELSVLAQVLGCYVVGQAIAATHPILAAISIGIGMQQAGWLAHDYVHGRGKWCSMMRCFGALTNGFSAEWWSHKHNMHHSFTNVDGKDGDIKLEPLYYLSPPETSGRPDSWLRKYQHIYGYPLYAMTYVLWRRHSVASAWARKDKTELALLVGHYAWLFGTLPLGVAIGSMLIGGFLVGSLVTATHQSEEIMYEDGSFVDIQFRSTREADVKNPLERWLWGGMDTQLIHHLFPTMPRYKLHKLRPIMQEWAQKHGYDFRISDSRDILKKNYKHLEGIAALETI